MKTTRKGTLRAICFLLVSVMVLSLSLQGPVSHAEEERDEKLAKMEKVLLMHASINNDQYVYRTYSTKKKVKSVKEYVDGVETANSDKLKFVSAADCDSYTDEIAVTIKKVDGQLNATKTYQLSYIRTKYDDFLSDCIFDNLGRIHTFHEKSNDGYYNYEYNSDGTISDIYNECYDSDIGRIEFFEKWAFDKKGHIKYHYIYYDYYDDYSYEYDSDGDVTKETIIRNLSGGEKHTYVYEYSYYPLGKGTVNVSDLFICNIPDVTHTGNPSKPFVSVKNGNTILKEGTDYTLEYFNNIMIGKAWVKITGKGNYTGSVVKYFNIVYDTTWNADVKYRAYVQSYGWQPWVRDGSVAGTYAQSKRLEGIKIQVTSKDATGGITYRTYVQKLGWQPWVKDGAYSGSQGKSLRIEAFQAKLTGDLANKYDLYYCVQSQKLGWLGWAKNGANAGSAGFGYRVEAVRMMLVKKGTQPPSSTKPAYQKKTS